MRYKIKFISILLFVFLMSACTATYRLEIVNHSTQPLKVTYKVKEGKQFQNLQTMSVEDWKNKNQPKPLSADAFTDSGDKRERTVTLAPNQVVILETGIWEPNKESGMMDIIDIKLSGASGEMNYSGDRFYKNLAKENSANYTIEYK